MGMIVTQPTPKHIMLGGLRFEVLEDPNFMEQIPPNAQALAQGTTISYHLLKSLLRELVAQGILKWETPPEDAPSGSALDNIQP